MRVQYPLLLMKPTWFCAVEGGACHPVSPIPARLAERAEQLDADGTAGMPDWEQAVECGFVEDRSQYLAVLHETALLLAEARLERALVADSPELIRMVRMLEEIDSAVNHLSERAVDWYRSVNPGFSRKSMVPPGKKVRDLLRGGSCEALQDILDAIDQLSERRSALAKQVSLKAAGVLPNCSALAGGLVAARIAAEAGGVRELALMPASAIQVLGAKNALFTHLARGTPPPKHGVIYQNSAVHGSRRERRGSVARVLAAKLAIAARIDYFRGVSDPVFIARAREAIRGAGRSR